MTIIRRSELEKHLQKMDEAYKKLKQTISGMTPNPNIYDEYHNNPEQYAEEFREVNDEDCRAAAEHFTVELKRFKSMKKMKAEKLARK